MNLEKHEEGVFLSESSEESKEEEEPDQLSPEFFLPPPQ